MVIYDFEVFKYDWLIVWLDTDTRKTHYIYNNKKSLMKMYKHYVENIWVGYNSRGYDQWILKGILAGFDPKEINDFIIVNGNKGWKFSQLLHKFPLVNYDTQYFFRSLKELEAFMGDNIQETTVPFDLNRPLTNSEKREVYEYCLHDVMETFKVFVELKDEFESHIGLVKEFDMGLNKLNKTKAQLSASILGATKQDYDDEFEISFAPTLNLKKYKFVQDWFENWANNSKDYSDKLKIDIADVPHVFAFGGLHGARQKYIGDGKFIMADVSSYYPAIMIEYNYLSRNVRDPRKYTKIRDERVRLKQLNDPREFPRKIVLNATFGASKFKYSDLYDPLQANNICINGQLLLLDLIEKLDGVAMLIQSNTDGLLYKLYNDSDEERFIEICEEWSKRTRMGLDYDYYKRVIQKDVNNYILVEEDGSLKRKGAYVKKLKPLDNHLPIVNKALVNYFVHGKPLEDTIFESDELIDFQFVTKVSRKYSHAIYNPTIFDIKYRDEMGRLKHKTGFKGGERRSERVFRVFASKSPSDGTLYKQHKEKETPDKTAGTPENCFIDNGDIKGKKAPSKLDKQWYVDVAKKRVNDFIGG